MSKGYYVFSTLTASQIYPVYTKVEAGQVPQRVAQVEIFGGANLVDKALQTPRGVCTPITEKQHELLQQSPGFKQHEDNGYLVVEARDYEPDSVAADMTEKDKSTPLTDASLKEKGLSPASTGDDETSTETHGTRGGKKTVRKKVKRKRRGATTTEEE